MPELKTQPVLALFNGLTALGTLASVEFPDIAKCKELGVAEGDRKAAIKRRSNIRFRVALALSKIQDIVQGYEKKANEALNEAALKKDGENVTSEIDVGGKKFSSVKINPEKEADYRTKMDGLDEESHDISLPQPFNETDFEQAMLMVPAAVLVQLGPMIRLE